MALKVLSSVSLYACRGAKASPKPDKFAKKSMKNLCGLGDERAFVRSYDSEVHFLATKNRRFHGGGEFSVPRGCNDFGLLWIEVDIFRMEKYKLTHSSRGNRIVQQNEIR